MTINSIFKSVQVDINQLKEVEGAQDLSQVICETANESFKGLDHPLENEITTNLNMRSKLTKVLTKLTPFTQKILSQASKAGLSDSAIHNIQNVEEVSQKLVGSLETTIHDQIAAAQLYWEKRAKEAQELSVETDQVVDIVSKHLPAMRKEIIKAHQQLSQLQSDHSEEISGLVKTIQQAKTILEESYLSLKSSLKPFIERSIVEKLNKRITEGQNLLNKEVEKGYAELKSSIRNIELFQIAVEQQLKALESSPQNDKVQGLIKHLSEVQEQVGKQLIQQRESFLIVEHKYVQERTFFWQEVIAKLASQHSSQVKMALEKTEQAVILLETIHRDLQTLKPTFKFFPTFDAFFTNQIAAFKKFSEALISAKWDRFALLNQAQEILETHRKLLDSFETVLTLEMPEMAQQLQEMIKKVKTVPLGQILQTISATADQPQSALDKKELEEYRALVKNDEAFFTYTNAPKLALLLEEIDEFISKQLSGTLTESSFDQLVSKCAELAHNRLKGIKGQLLDSDTSSNTTTLHGMSFAANLADQLVKLQEYRDYLLATGQTLPSKLARLFTEIDFALRIANNRFSDEFTKPGEAIVARIKDLPSSDQAGEVILEGGHLKHAVVYSIKRMSEHAFSFTIINTGDGSEAQMGKKRDLLSGQEVEYLEARDIVYRDLPLELLNASFFELLASFQKPDAANIDMDMLLKIIDSKLRIKSDNKDNKVQGRAHAVQKGGTCALKSITSWLHGRLGDDYYAFKSFASERAAKELDEAIDLLEKLPMKGKWFKILGIKTDHKEFVGRMRQAAGKILHKRHKKAQKVAERHMDDRKISVVS